MTKRVDLESLETNVVEPLSVEQFVSICTELRLLRDLEQHVRALSPHPTDGRYGEILYGALAALDAMDQEP